MALQIQRISVSGLRTLDEFSIELGGLNVLIGENGSGKSTLVEAVELLRRLTGPKFFSEFNGIHGGGAMLRRFDADRMMLGASLGNDTDVAEYSVSFDQAGISQETLHWRPFGGDADSVPLIDRTGEQVQGRARKGASNSAMSGVGNVKPQQVLIALNGWAHPDPVVAEVSAALRAIDVQLPFNTTSNWVARSEGRPYSPLRDSVTIAPADQLERFGVNLPNAFFALRIDASPDEWDYTMELVRLGLGTWVESVLTRPDAGGGKIGLWVKLANTDRYLPAASLSDGQLAYLAFVALARLPTERSILVFDEIELHLHPGMLTHVMSLMRMIAARCPVLLTTHSRRVLDDLDDPATSVGVLKLDPTSLRTILRRLDAGELSAWLDNYSGLGQLLDAGYRESLFAVSLKDAEAAL